MQYTNIGLNVFIYFNDGSTDCTVDTIIGCNLSIPHKIIKNQVNKGVGFVRNKLIKSVQTNYFLFLDSDDVLSVGEIQINESNYIFPDLLFFEKQIPTRTIQQNMQNKDLGDLCTFPVCLPMSDLFDTLNKNYLIYECWESSSKQIYFERRFVFF